MLELAVDKSTIDQRVRERKITFTQEYGRLPNGCRKPVCISYVAVQCIANRISSRVRLGAPQVQLKRDGQKSAL